MLQLNCLHLSLVISEELFFFSLFKRNFAKKICISYMFFPHFTLSVPPNKTLNCAAVQLVLEILEWNCHQKSGNKTSYQ